MEPKPYLRKKVCQPVGHVGHSCQILSSILELFSDILVEDLWDLDEFGRVLSSLLDMSQTTNPYAGTSAMRLPRKMPRPACNLCSQDPLHKKRETKHI